MARSFHGLAAALAGGLLLGTLACAAAPPNGRASDGIGNAVVIGDESFGSGSGSMLTVLQNHVRGMSVAATDNCPHIVMRAGAARSQVAEALVYIDGQRMSDTCILEGLDLEAIDHVEVYPSGVTQRPGYRSNSGGLILVFTKNGPAATRKI